MDVYGWQVGVAFAKEYSTVYYKVVDVQSEDVVESGKLKRLTVFIVED